MKNLQKKNQLEKLIHHIALLTKTNEILVQKISNGGGGGGGGGGVSEKNKESPGEVWIQPAWNKYRY